MAFRLELIGFEKLKAVFSPARVPKRLKKHVGKATDLNAQLGASEVIRAIQTGVSPPNSPLTIALKGSSRTLVDSGALAGSIVGKGVAWDEGRIGALRKKRAQKVSKKVKGAKYTTDISALLYFGATVTVTDKMRRLFFALASDPKHKGKIMPLSSRTKVIVIPPRRYLDAALTPQMEQRYKDNWLAAIERTLRGED